MRIAVTGGRGRMGTALVAAAATSGHDVVSIDVSPAGPGPAEGKPRDKPAGRVIELTADATSYEQLKGALRGCDAVVHLAGRPAPVPWPAHEVHNTNVVANYNALCVAVELGVEHVCLASSINAVGAAFSRRPRFDYFPLDEAHPTYNEDPYSLSKWICEAQADSVSRRHANLTIGSLRLHHLVPMRALELPSHYRAALHRELWGYTTFEAAARACLAVLAAPWKGHEAFFVVAPRLALDEPTMALCDEFFPEVPLRRAFVGNEGLFSCNKASDMLGWEHDDIREGAT